MLDLKYIRNNPEKVKQACKNKNDNADIDRIVKIDERRREVLQIVEGLKAERNEISKTIGKLMKENRAEAERVKVKAGELSGRIKGLDAEEKEIEKELETLMLRVPNIPNADVPVGGESDNKILREEGTKRNFDFEPQDHITVMAGLDTMDLPRAAKMTGSFFSLFKGEGSRLVRSLINFMIDLHTREHGFTEIAPPFVANYDGMKNTGQIPKLEDDMYRLEGENFFLIPTAEVVLTNYHADEMLREEMLPIKYVGYTPCFRKEAGAYGADTKGLMRLHQFDKVELVLFTKPEESYAMHEKLLGYSERVLRELGLPYRVLLLATGDLSFAAAKCYDIEVFAPADGGKWLEVSSCSNFEDFQARRGNIRYRKGSDKPEFVHTLNSSGVALPRLIIAIIENYQRADGRVDIPEALVPYFGKETMG